MATEQLLPQPPAAKTDALWRQWLHLLAKPRNALFVLFLLSPLITWFCGAPWYLSAGLLAFVLVLSAALLNRRGGLGLIGPHFFYDLVRLGRRPRTWDTRIIYAVILLVGIGLVYFFRFPLRDWESLFVSKGSIQLSDASNLAQRFAFTIVFLQNLAIFILAPPYLAPVIAEEREKGTLELLYTTHLRSHQIVLAKFFARVVHLAVIVLGGLPILMLVQLWGGLDIPTVLANFTLMFFNLLAIGSVALLASALSQRVVTAVMVTYGVVLPLGFCLGGLSLGAGEGPMGMYEMRVGWLVASIIFQLPITVTCVGATIVTMRVERLSERRFPVRVPRHLRRRPPPLPRGSVQQAAQLAEERAQERAPSIMRVREYDLPPMTSDPLYWKEVSLGHRPFFRSPWFYTVLGVAAYAVVSIFLSVLVNAASERSQPWSERVEVLSYVLRGLAILYGMLLCLGMGFYCAASVVRERQAKTLDSLLSIPVERRAILGAKWLGALNRNLGWLLCLGLISVFGLLTGAIHIAGAMLLTAVPVIHAAFFASLGLYLSVVCRTLLEAFVKLALLAFGLVAGSWMAGLVLDWAGHDTLRDLVGFGLNPPWAWYTVGFSYPEFSMENPQLLPRVSGCLLGLGIYIVLAIGFWFLACRAFQKERYRHVE